MLRMEASDPDGRHELKRHLENQMRAQERQLVWVRLGMVLVAALFLLVFEPGLASRPILFVLLGVVALSILAIPWLLTRFPAREVGIVSTALDMAAVTVAVYFAGDTIDAHLFYGLVILGTALRFGLGASVWSSVVMSGLYVAVVLLGPADEAIRVAAPGARGVPRGHRRGGRTVQPRGHPARDGERAPPAAAGRGRARSRACPGARAAQPPGARLRRLARPRDHHSRHRRRCRHRCSATPPWSCMIDDAERRLAAGRRAAERTRTLPRAGRSHVAERRPRMGEGIIGGVAATAGSVDGNREAVAAGRSGRPGGARPRVGPGRADPGRRAAAGRAGQRRPRRARSPSERIRRLAEAIAERAGPALQNAQLWSDLQERMTREQAAQRIKDDFLSIVSHELRTPLTSIQGYSQLLEARLRTDRDGESKEMAHLRVIRSQVGRMRRLVDDLLDVSRIDRRGGVSIETVDFDLADAGARGGRARERENRDREHRA